MINELTIDFLHCLPSSSPPIFSFSPIEWNLYYTVIHRWSRISQSFVQWNTHEHGIHGSNIQVQTWNEHNTICDLEITSHSVEIVTEVSNTKLVLPIPKRWWWGSGLYFGKNTIFVSKIYGLLELIPWSSWTMMFAKEKGDDNRSRERDERLKKKGKRGRHTTISLSQSNRVNKRGREKGRLDLNDKREDRKLGTSVWIVDERRSWMSSSSTCIRAKTLVSLSLSLSIQNTPIEANTILIRKGGHEKKPILKVWLKLWYE